MTVSPFQVDLGVQSGRIQPQGWTVPDGSYVVCLGHDEPGFWGKLLGGDYVEISQTADFGATKLVRLRACLRPPETPLDSGLRWRASCRIDSTEVLFKVFDASRKLQRFDWAINVSKLAAGNHTLRFRLTLEEI